MCVGTTLTHRERLCSPCVGDVHVCEDAKPIDILVFERFDVEVEISRIEALDCIQASRLHSQMSSQYMASCHRKHW